MDAFQTFLPFVGREFSVLVLVAIGFAVGVLAGFFGMGGGWVLTPALYSFGFPMQFAIGTGLANITAQSALATVKHRKMGNVDCVLGMAVGVPMMVGVEAGKRVVTWLVSVGLAGTVVGWVYVVLLVALAAYMVRDYVRTLRRASPAPESDGSLEADPSDGTGRRAAGGLRAMRPTVRLPSCGVEVSVWLLVGLGLLVGFLAGLLGTGGGFALVPAFVYLIGTPTLVAVGSSLLCVVLSGAYGAFTYGREGNVEIIAVLWMLAGAAVGAQLGAAATRYARGHGIRLLYAVMLLLATCGLVMKQLAVMPNAEGDSRLAPVVILGGAVVMCLMILWRMAASLMAGGRGGGVA